MLRRPASDIAVSHHEVEAADENLVPRRQWGRVYTGFVYVGPIGRAAVLNCEFIAIEHKATVVTRDGDIVEKDVAFGVTPCSGVAFSEYKREPGTWALLYNQCIAFETPDMGCFVFAERMLRPLAQGHVDHGRVVFDLDLVLFTAVSPAFLVHLAPDVREE
jgi:hypothetical protein